MIIRKTLCAIVIGAALIFGCRSREKIDNNTTSERIIDHNLIERKVTVGKDSVFYKMDSYMTKDKMWSENYMKVKRKGKRKGEIVLEFRGKDEYAGPWHNLQEVVVSKDGDKKTYTSENEEFEGFKEMLSEYQFMIACEGLGLGLGPILFEEFKGEGKRAEVWRNLEEVLVSKDGKEQSSTSENEEFEGFKEIFPDYQFAIAHKRSGVDLELVPEDKPSY